MTIYRQNRDRYLEDKPASRFRSPSRGDDNINHPAHYTAYQGMEVIDLVEQMNFNRGNAVKYIARAGLKSTETEVEDLKKAIWYLTREIQRLESE